jgi:hypothetical protein
MDKRRGKMTDAEFIYRLEAALTRMCLISATKNYKNDYKKCFCMFNLLLS